MSIEIVPQNYDYPEYDMCGSLTYAVLIINGIAIPLCLDCIKELKDEVKAFNETVFCYKCKKFTPNKYGINYGGECQKNVEDGNGRAVDFMQTCEYAEKKEDV